MIEKSIAEFIRVNQVLTLACSLNDEPYCFNAFYAFVEHEGLIVFKSNLDTRHAEILQLNSKVSGTVIPEKIELMSLKGLQFTGEILPLINNFSTAAASAYYFRFPFAMAIPGQLWVVRLDWAKLTDNGKGFGHKEKWQR